MGIKSFWQLLDDIKESKSLLAMAVDHRLRAQSTGISGRDATLRLGVDMGTCVTECNAAASKPGVRNPQAGGGLYIFFKKLAEFTKAPVNLVFVLDGPERPPVKRGHEVRDRPVWWIEPAVQLIDMFGHHIHRAPGEAEAELARLNSEGYVHAIITCDSDAFLFGAQLLLRSISKCDKSFPDEYSLYSANRPDFPLTQGGMLLYALLCGSDYDHGLAGCKAEHECTRELLALAAASILDDKIDTRTRTILIWDSHSRSALAGCGPTTSVALACCGFGDQLLDAYRSHQSADFERFLRKWRPAVQSELLTNSQQFLSRRQFDIAGEISHEFPDRRTLQYYTNPITSWSPGRIPPDPSQWEFTQPSILLITHFCEQYFHWTPQVMKKKFEDQLWEGIFLQMLYSLLTPSRVVFNFQFHA
ncbi:PIN domain-like protein [Pholiota molesta]|nr:PIN domain-like protein [Pholiota molesta]